VTKIVTMDKGGQISGSGAPPRGRLRIRMPHTAAFLDQVREQFGAGGIDASIAAGMRGELLRFHAREGELEIGTPLGGEWFAARRSDGLGLRR
jgi:hypothetical protein